MNVDVIYLISYKNVKLSTVELPCRVEHILNHESMFKTEVVRANEC